MHGDGHSVLERAFGILGAFRTSSESLPLTTLSLRAGLPKSSTLRLARQLVELGALERTEDGEYCVGLRLFEMAALAPRAHGLRATAMPYMEDLHRYARQHVQLSVRDGLHSVLIERLSARDAGLVSLRIGGRAPLIGTGAGRVLLAYAPQSVQQAVAELGVGGWDVSDCRSPAAFHSLLAEIRQQGFTIAARDRPEPEMLVSVAAPIVDNRVVIASVSVLAPKSTLDTRACLAAVLDTARGISRELTLGARAAESHAEASAVTAGWAPLATGK